MSATHSRLGPGALNSRFTKSGPRSGPLGLRVVIGAPPFALAGQPSAAHQPGCVLAATVNALAAQYAPHLPDPVDAVILSMNVTNVLHENSVAKTAGA